VIPLCEKCRKREAKVFVTAIQDGQSLRQHLCEQCDADAVGRQSPKVRSRGWTTDGPGNSRFKEHGD